MEAWELDSALQNTVTELKLLEAALEDLEPGTEETSEKRGDLVDRLNIAMSEVGVLIKAVQSLDLQIHVSSACH